MNAILGDQLFSKISKFIESQTESQQVDSLQTYRHQCKLDMFCSDWKRTKNHLCRTIASGVCKRSKHSCCFIAKKRNSRRSVRGVIGILSLRYKKIKGSFVQYMSWAWVMAFVPKIHVIKILSLQVQCKKDEGINFVQKYF